MTREHQPARRLGRRTVLAASLAGLAARPVGAQQPVRVTDVRGETVVLPRAAERIVLGFYFEEFTAIGGPEGWERVVGFARSQWSTNRAVAYPRYAAAISRLSRLPDVGNNEAGTFSVETIVSLRPDVVILPDVWTQPLREQIAQIRALGIPIVVVDYNMQVLDRHIASTLALGAVLGRSDRAAELARLYQGKVEDVQRRAAAAGRKPRVYVELGQGGPATVGNSYWKAMWGRILDIVNADNIAAGRIAGGWGPVNPEHVLAADPELVFIAGSSWTGWPEAVLTGYGVDPTVTRARLAPYAGRPGWAGLTAIRTGQLHAIEHGLCRSILDFVAMQYLAKQIHPGQFSDVDPVAELRRFHEHYLPIALDGTWMIKAS